MLIATVQTQWGGGSVGGLLIRPLHLIEGAKVREKERKGKKTDLFADLFASFWASLACSV